MRIERLRIDNFLGFDALEVELDPALTVVLAPNEGGKSTLLRAIGAALFTDASSRSTETKGLARWGSGELFRVELAFALAGERCVLVRDFRTKEQDVRVEGTVVPAARGRAVPAFLRERLALDEDLFRRVCIVPHEELAAIAAGPSGIGEKLEEVLGGAPGGRTPAEAMRVVDEKRKELNRGRDGRANRENWGALRRLREEAASLEAALGRARDIEHRREGFMKEIAGNDARLAGLTKELLFREERLAQAERFEDLENEEREKLERSRELQDRLDRIGKLDRERAVLAEAISRLPALLVRGGVPALDELAADLEREAALEREIERSVPPAARGAAWGLALGLCLVAGGVAGAILWKGVLAIAAAAGAAVLAWHFLRRRAGAGTAREYARREIEALRGKRESWAGGASREEATRLVGAAREARRRLSEVEGRIEENAGTRGPLDGIVAALERELGDRAIDLRGVQAERKAIEAFRLDPVVIGAEKSEIRARKDETQRLRDESTMARGRLAELERERLAFDAASIEERLEAAREDLERAERKASILDIVAEALGEARGRMKGTLAARLPALAAARLAGITGGRYGALFLNPLTLAVEVAPAASDLAAGAAAGPAPERVSPASLSQGARDQIYFAVRLALVDLLGGAESLPVFFDDPFVHFDPERRERAVEMLREFARSHQVVLFTCDPAYRAIGGRLVELRR